MKGAKMDYDWTEVKLLYITSNKSIREVAEHFGIPEATVRSRAQKEKWSEGRSEHRQNVIEKASKKIANSAAKRLAKEYRVATKLTGILQKALKDDNQFCRYIVTEGYDGELQTKEKIFEKIDMQALSAAAKVLKQTVDIKRTIGGYLNDAEQESADIALRKLELEEKRGGFNTDDEGGGVIELPTRITDEQTEPEGRKEEGHDE
ncbi:MAG: hypothetical protein J6B51_03010 [Clostridia bacterium]|nr:hypothetical protein [Clostridia bacterium]